MATSQSTLTETICSMMYTFNIYVDGVLDASYEFDTKEKAESWQSRFISDMKKIGCWPLKGVKTQVEQK